MQKRQATTIKIDPDLWKEARKYAIDKEITISSLVESLLQKELRGSKNGKKK